MDRETFASVIITRINLVDSSHFWTLIFTSIFIIILLPFLMVLKIGVEKKLYGIYNVTNWNGESEMVLPLNLKKAQEFFLAIY